MSLGLEKLNFVSTADPRVDLEKLEKLLYSIETTGTTNSYEEFPITNFNANTLNVNVNPPNKDNIVSRRFYLKVEFDLTFVGKSGLNNKCLIQAAQMNAVPALPANTNTAYYDAPRAYALANALNTIQVNLNGQPVNTNLNQYIRALTRFKNNVDCMDIYRSYMPSMLDQFLAYSEGQNFPARDPLRGYGDNMVMTPRGSYWGATITRNDSNNVQGDTAVVHLILIEPIYLSPLGFGCHDNLPGFLGISTITLLATLGGRGQGVLGGIPGALWSHSTASPATFSSITSKITGASFFAQYFAPPLNMKIPKTLVYGYQEPYYVSTIGQKLVAGDQKEIPVQNTQLTGIPKMVYVWVAQQDLDVDMTSTDTYCSIEGINITWNSTPGILSTATSIDLYNISTRNGINMNYSQFSNHCGSVLALKFGEDIQVNTTQSSGLLGSYQISMKITCTNNYSFDIIPQVGLLFVYEGTFTIDTGVVLKQINILTQNDILDTKTNAKMLEYPPHAHDALGGLAWSDVTNFFKRIGKEIIRPGINLAKQIVPAIAPQYAPVVVGADVLAQNLGFGRAKGGKKLTRKQMLKMMGQ